MDGWIRSIKFPKRKGVSNVAYTNAEKTEMYESIQDDLTNVVVRLQDFLESDVSDTELSEEQRFASATNSQLANLIGNVAIRKKRCETEK